MLITCIIFHRKQPDLNWENPQLRKEVFDIMKFWADKGIDGFRLDAFQFAAKDTSFPVFPAGYEKNFNCIMPWARIYMIILRK